MTTDRAWLCYVEEAEGTNLIVKKEVTEKTVTLILRQGYFYHPLILTHNGLFQLYQFLGAIVMENSTDMGTQEGAAAFAGLAGFILLLRMVKEDS